MIPFLEVKPLAAFSQELCHSLRRGGASCSVFGSLAVWARCERVRTAFAWRSGYHPDIDLLCGASDEAVLLHAMAAKGYQRMPNDDGDFIGGAFHRYMLNERAADGAGRRGEADLPPQIFVDVFFGRPTAEFYPVLALNHEDGYLSVPDLILTKLSIPAMRDTDVTDCCALLAESGIASLSFHQAKLCEVCAQAFRRSLGQTVCRNLKTVGNYLKDNWDSRYLELAETAAQGPASYCAADQGGLFVNLAKLLRFSSN